MSETKSYLALGLAGLVAGFAGLGFLPAGCSGSDGGCGAEGGFCEADADCCGALACRQGICMLPSSDICDPPCGLYQACVGGTCRSVINPNDKDADGSLVADDCDDFNHLVHPGAFEHCDGRDNNCQEGIDEGCPPCGESASQPCGTDLGDCTAGLQVCAGGLWQVCGGQAPRPEACDGRDNDCDGLTDEVCPCQGGEPLSCSTDQGVCTKGGQLCVEGSWVGCVGAQMPVAEICDGQDNDCDGQTDNGFMTDQTCEGEGECPAGFFECHGGQAVRCSTDPGGSQDGSQPDVCDSLDNDCDGQTDEEIDADSDGVIGCGGPDCCDIDSRAFPGTAEYYTSANNCGSFDYDCSGVNESQFTSGYSCTVRCTSYTDGWYNVPTPDCGGQNAWGTGCRAALIRCDPQTTAQKVQACH